MGANDTDVFESFLKLVFWTYVCGENGGALTPRYTTIPL